MTKSSYFFLIWRFQSEHSRLARILLSIVTIFHIYYTIYFVDNVVNKLPGKKIKEVCFFLERILLRRELRLILGMTATSLS